MIIHLLLHYFVLLRDGSERREGRQAFEEYIERLKSRVAELEKKLYESRTEVHQLKVELEEKREPDPEMMRLMKQVQALKLENEKLLCAHDEVSVSVCLSVLLMCLTVNTITHIAYLKFTDPPCNSLDCYRHDLCTSLILFTMQYGMQYFRNQ